MAWYSLKLQRNQMSDELAKSSGSLLTVINLDKYGAEIEGLVGGITPPDHKLAVVTEEGVEDPAVFVLERHLEDFLVHNWSQTALGQTHDILSVDGAICGQQYPSDTGPIDILAVSKDRQELLVIELKKGKASDTVVGQTQRYMGFVKEVLAEPGQAVRGMIIALEDDVRIRRALSVAPDIEFYRYRVSFELVKT
jgi:restriction system protein